MAKFLIGTVVGSFLLTGCSLLSTTPTSSAPTSAEPRPASSPSASASAGPSKAPPSGLHELTADDLIEGFVSVKQLTKIQGFPFEAESDYPKWTESLPLGDEHGSEISFGYNRATKPVECGAVSYLDATGFLMDQAKAPLVTAAAFSNNVNTYKYFRDQVFVWQTVAYLMADGMANHWQTNAKAMVSQCRTYRAISRSGDVEEAGNEKAKDLFSGDLLVRRILTNSGKIARLYMSEAIGNVLYWTYLDTHVSNLADSTRVYNKQANALATAQGTTRVQVDLTKLKPFTSDPTKYLEVPLVTEGQT